MYSHISTGWYGKEWGGDHQAMDDCLRLYAAMQSDDGFIRWVSPSLMPFDAENNTPYWVDQVWWHYAWTGDLQFVRDLWPNVRKAVAWQCEHRRPRRRRAVPGLVRVLELRLQRQGPEGGRPQRDVVGDARPGRAARRGRRRREGRSASIASWPTRAGRRSSASCGARRPGGWAPSAARGSGAAIRRPGRSTWRSTRAC